MRKRAVGTAAWLCGLAFAVSGTQTAVAGPNNTRRTVVQPGARVFVPENNNNKCTAGFLVKDSRGVIYVINDSRCISEYVGDTSGLIVHRFHGVRTWAPGKGSVAVGFIPKAHRIGSFVLQAMPDIGPTYSLLRLDPNIPYSGAVAGAGGPISSPYTGETTSPTPVTWVCHDDYSDFVPGGADYDSGVNQDVAIYGITRNEFTLAQAINGQCFGGPVIGLNGPYALGILGPVSARGADPTNPTGQDGGGTVVRLDAIMADASMRLHSTLTLLSAGKHGRTQR